MFAQMIQHPVFWLFPAGIFAGGAAALVFTPARGRENPDRFRRTRPVKICFLLTGFVICAAAALFAAASGFGFVPRFLYAAAAGFVFGCLGFRFIKAAGLPLLVVCAAAFVLCAGGLSGWNAARKSVLACRVIVLSIEPETALSVNSPGRAETLVRVPAAAAAEFRVATDFLTFPAAYPVLGCLSFYRPAAVLSGAARQEFLPAGEPSIWEKILLALPGAEIRTYETPLPPLALFSAYSLFVGLSDAPPYFAEAGEVAE